MNCKKGDIAIVVSSIGSALGIRSCNIGKTVTCLELMPAGYDGCRVSSGPVWRVDREIIYINVKTGKPGRPRFAIHDKYLMPIRGEPDEAEQPESASLSTPAHE